MVDFPPRQESVITSWPKTLTVDFKKSYWQQDPKGYFLIAVDRIGKRLIVGFLSNDHKPVWKIVGEHPIEMYYTIFKHIEPTFPHHAAYLGEELAKAYIALQQNIDYTQDKDLDFTKSHQLNDRDKEFAKL